MWKDIQGGKVLRKQVRDERGRLISKIFRIEQIVGEGEDWRVATVIDEDTMVRCTLKMLIKNDSICKSQIVSQIKNQKKMTGRPNFIELKAVYEDANIIYLLMQLWGVPLQKVLLRRKTLMEREVQLIFCQLVDILENLRSANISHGNIELQSVLLASNQENVIQLTDFTYSYDTSTDEYTSDKNSQVGSENKFKAKWAVENSISNDELDDQCSNPILKSGTKEINEYISPQEYYDDKNVSKISYERDVWACGVLLFKLLTGMFPFTGEGGKLILNKIRFATFSFPSLEEVEQAVDQELQCHFRNKGCLNFLSTEWKQLLKRMLSIKSQRITLKQLINHPFKMAYFQLKNIPSLKTSQPQLSLLLSTKTNNRSALFKKSWNINYEQEGQNDCDITEQVSQVYLDQLTYKRNPNRVQQLQKNENQVVNRQSIRTGTAFQKNKQNDTSYVQIKNFRTHKTQFGFGDLTKIIGNARHQAGAGVKDKRKRQKQISLYTPFSTKEQSLKMPHVAREPPFIIKFKMFKRNNSLGYILNNSVGVIFDDGEHLIGHTKDDFRYIQELHEEDSQTLIDNSDPINHYSRHTKQSIYKSQSKNLLRLRNTKEHSLKNTIKPKPNFFSQQVSAQNLDVNPKYTTSNLIQCKFKNQSLSRQKLDIYLKTLEHFGERVVKGALDVWIDKFWRNGNTFVFLLNTGCWQVAFCEIKGFRIYAVDQYDLSWSKDAASSDVLHCVRQIIRNYERQIKVVKIWKI